MRLYPPLLGALLLFAPSLALAHGDHGPLTKEDLRRLQSSDRAKIPQHLLAPFQNPPDAHGRAATRTGNSLADYERAIKENHDPDLSAVFINDKKIQAELRKNDPDKLTELFDMALSFKDVKDLWVMHAGEGDFGSEQIRLAFYSRYGNHLLYMSAPDLARWTRTHIPDISPEFIAKAIYEWNHLSDEQQRWLITVGESTDTWERHSFDERYEPMLKWGKARFDELIKRVPKSQGQLKTLNQDAGRIWGSITREQRSLLGEHQRNAIAAVRSMEDAGRLIQNAKGNERLQLQRALNNAKHATSLNGMLSHLGQLFDNAGERNSALDKARPPTEAERFSKSDRATLESMLSGTLIKELNGTTAGGKVRDFYKKHALKLRIGDLDAVAVYDSETDEITIGEKNVLEYLKVNNGTVKQLLTDPRVFNPLVVELSATFVHEATHHMQKEWRATNKLPDIYSQGSEIEAMAVETLFFMEKLASDKEFKSVVDKNKNSSSLIQDSLEQAQRLNDRYRTLANTVRMGYYPGQASLEGQVKTETLQMRHTIQYMQEEVSRRKVLSPWQRQKIELLGSNAVVRPYFPRDFWKKTLTNTTAPAIHSEIVYVQGQIHHMPEVFSTYQERYAAVEVATTQRKNELARGEVNPNKDIVPSPTLPG